MNENKFVRDGNIIRSNENHFIELAQYGNCAVLMRFYGGGIEEDYEHKRLDFLPYVVAIGYNPADGTWGAGSYFDDLFKAVNYAKSKADERRISYERMSEIASKSIDGLFIDDAESAYEYCKEEIEMTEEEMNFFGIDKNRNNQWVLNYPDIMRYYKKIENRKFQFIEMVWLDTCKGDEGYPDKEYTVKSAIVDLDDYTPGDIECNISSYGYENIDDIYETYGIDGEQVVAECIFAEMCDGSATTYGMMTKDEAKNFIWKYIEEN